MNVCVCVCVCVYKLYILGVHEFVTYCSKQLNSSAIFVWRCILIQLGLI